jgi:hypothetical protein
LFRNTGTNRRGGQHQIGTLAESSRNSQTLGRVDVLRFFE